MIELNDCEIELVSGGESQLAHEAIGVGIIMGGVATGNPLIFGLGVLYLATN